MIFPLSGLRVGAIVQNPMYRDFADDVPVVSLNIKLFVSPELFSFVNLNVDVSS